MLTPEEIEKRISAATVSTLKKIADTSTRTQKMVQDLDRDRRLSLRLCRYCHNTPAIAGQMFTTYECQFCGTEETHPNTAVPRLCKSCSKDYECCQRCLARIKV